MPNKTIEDFAYQVRDYMRSAEVVEGKNQLVPHNVKMCPLTGDVGENTFITPSGGNTAVVAKIQPNTQYVASHIGGNRFRLALSTDYPVEGGSCYVLVSDETLTDYTFNSGNYNYVLLHCYNVIQSDEYIKATIKPMCCTESDWNKSHTYEPYYVPVKDRVDELDEIIGDEWETVIPTIESQTKYEYRSISSIKRKGKIIQGVIRIKSLTGNEMPIGKTYTTVASGLPQIPADLQFFIPSGTSLLNNPLEVLYNTNGTITMRGGSIDDYYNCSFVGWIV